MCACTDTFLCARCADSPADPAYLDHDPEPEYRPHAGDGKASADE